ncbi:hypothetical protein MNEG_6128 [Monoraphidium neglectum]|uniref:Uncharacterized protein n=1 Tax=Monoraphidium neglectum TaxID=145388 RepID=A0A0D2MMP4_9CHLO|nr:hypothetical protein MNEG_6128 [Monoraphidium neglectum]KIZ01832.1 hypothetical protein MNEG_6128 [Monoraphidium neglectum]|eukprot:XP_013900851.1 hypothetical protein MNEG_6128 [Monoraphidium neglectum]
MGSHSSKYNPMRANILTRVMSWPALVFTFCTWVVFLAGIASLQRTCADGTTGLGQTQARTITALLRPGRDPGCCVPYQAAPDNLNTFGTQGIFGWSGSVLPCLRLFRFYWFMIAFLLVTLLGAFVASGPKYGLSSSRPFWIGMFTINTLLFMIASEATLAALDSSPFSSGQPLMSMRTAAAGAIMTVVGCIFLLLTIGTDWENRRGRAGVAKTTGPGYAGQQGLPTTAAGPGAPVGAGGPVTYTGNP